MKNLTTFAALWALMAGLAVAGPIYEPKQIIVPETGHWYVSGFGGWTWTDETTFNSGDANGLAPTSSTINFDGGDIFGGAFGYQFVENAWGALRLEVEGSARDIDEEDPFRALANIPPNTLFLGSVTGDVDAPAVMVNLIQDFDVGWGALRPYVGAGIGVAFVDVDLNVNFGAQNGFGPFTGVLQGDDSAFAYQFMAGLEYAWTSRLMSYVEYRASGNSDIDLQWSLPTPAPVTGPDTATGDWPWSHHLILGLRYLF